MASYEMGGLFLTITLVWVLGGWAYPPTLGGMVYIVAGDLVVVLSLALKLAGYHHRAWGALARHEATRDARMFFLYIRSFRERSHQYYTDEEFQLDADSRVPVIRNHFVFLLAEASIAIGRLVMISPDDLVVPHAIVLRPRDERWFDCFTRAADLCRAIIVIPQLSPSLMKEVGAIRERYGSKVIVYMAPEGVSVHALREGHEKSEWEKVAAVLLTRGIALPAYDPGGMLYLAHTDWSVVRKHPLNGMVTPESIRCGLEQLSSSLPATGVALAEALPALCGYEQ